MNANKPRESVLNLFDPLNTPPETPTRETQSPDSSSDKENDGPTLQPGQLTVFFNRVYTHPKMAKMPRGKLIDFEETNSIAMQEDPGFTDAPGDSEDETDENYAQEDPSHAPTDTDSSQIYAAIYREPLVDIKLERVPHPNVQLPPTIEEEESALEGSYSLGASLPPSEGSVTAITPAVSEAPSGTPLADVINSINLGSLTIHAEAGQSETVFGESSSDKACPDITIIPTISEPPSPSPMQTANAFLSPVIPPTVFSPPVRRQHVSTSPNDPRRASVDLQSSFSLQLQSSDLSFDLMNDKISFFSQGQDSFWSGADEDDTMDLAKEELKMKLNAERYECIKEEEEIEPVPVEKLRTPPQPQSDCIVPTPHKSPLRAPVFTPPPKVAEPVAVVSPIASDLKHPESCLSDDPQHSLPLPPTDTLTRHIHPMPAGPALRIVKKSFKVHDRAESSSSNGTISSLISKGSGSSEETPSTACNSRSNSRAGSVLSDGTGHGQERSSGPVVATGISTVIKGVQRPPAGFQVALPPTRTGSTARVSTLTQRTSVLPPSQALAVGKTKSGAGRPGLLPLRPTPSAVQRPFTSRTVAGPSVKSSKMQMQRPLASAAASARADPLPPTGEVAKKIATGLRVPSRLAAPSTTTGTGTRTAASMDVRSALPRPTSRLPTLSRITGTKPPLTTARK